MNAEFRKLLENAKGISQHVIAINLDIRGFTPFCKGKDSFDVAAYLIEAYSKIIDDYFSDANFYKPTGDGLLIVIVCENRVKPTVSKTVESCLKLLEHFESLCEGEHRIYFPTPDKIGMGIARGSACCIASGNKTLDYSGKVLNLASRLMEMARPSGIVLDASLGFNLLSKEMKEMFSEEAVCVRGIAEDEQIKVYFTKRYTLIPAFHKKPIREPVWKTSKYWNTLEWCERNRSRGNDAVLLSLDEKPLDKDQVVVEITFEVEGSTAQYFFYVSHKMVRYRRIGTLHQITLGIDELIRFLKSHEVAQDTEVDFIVHYPVKQ